MATPFKAVITVLNDAGQRTSIPLVGTDVTAVGLTFPDGSVANKLSSLHCKIVDMIFPSTSITQCIIYINGIDTGVRVQNSASLGTTYSRQLQNAPVDVPAGALVSFYQLT
jgi:hypothetical protein